jgi:hypothetical protein
VAVGTTEATTPLLALKRLYFSEERYCCVIVLITQALVMLPL